MEENTLKRFKEVLNNMEIEINTLVYYNDECINGLRNEHKKLKAVISKIQKPTSS